MERKVGYFRSLFDGMNMASVEIASSTAIIKNPIDESIKTLYTNPQKKKIKDVDYVKFGASDDIPAVLQALLNKSSTHAGIVHKKAKMISGEELSFEGITKNTEFDVFTDNAGGTNVSLSDVFKQAAFFYELQGAVGFLVRYESKKPVLIKAISPLNLRCLPPDNDGNIVEWLMRHTFKFGSGDIWSNEEKKIPVFDSQNLKDEMIVYIKNPHSTNEFYGLPNYISAYNFIEADYEFGVTIKNSAANGFSPKVLATLIGRNLSDEQKALQAKKLKSNFQGSDGEQMIVSWVRKAEEKPEFMPIDVTNLDKMIDTMANLNDAKILTAHSIVNPSLFGVQVAGKLGNTGVEIEAAYNIFRATETLPTRDLLLDGLNLIFKYSSWNKVVVDVIDPDIITEELRGGDTSAKETVVEEDNEDKE